jgi:hypothetical protein
MSGAVLLLPLYAFKAWRGKTLPSALLKIWYMEMLQGNVKKQELEGSFCTHIQMLTDLLEGTEVCCVSGST